MMNAEITAIFLLVVHGIAVLLVLLTWPSGPPCPACHRGHLEKRTVSRPDLPPIEVVSCTRCSYSYTRGKDG